MINPRVTIPLLIAMMVLTVFVIQPRIFGAAARHSDAGYVQVIVGPGDTVWDLARDHGPDGVDLRRIIYAIKEANELDTFVIHPGQTLNIPASK